MTSILLTGAGPTFSGGVAPSFTPADLTGLQLWLDASDSSTVLNSISPDTPATDGQTVRRWLDKSVNGFHADQATAANQPLLDADGQNSKGVLTFDGVNDFFTSGTTSTWNFLYNGTESLVVIVARADKTTDADTLLSLGARVGQTGYNLFSYNVLGFTNALHVSVRSSSGEAVNDKVDTTFTAGAWFIVENKIDADNATASLRSVSKVNGGSEIGNNAETAAASTSDSTTALKIGEAQVGSTAFWRLEGAIAEIIICSDPNTANRENLRNYLASKWGITLS